MGAGEVVVGHIEHQDELDAIVGAGSTLIHSVRNLRDVLVSVFRFMTCVVAPDSAADAVWRAVPEPSGFLAFLAYFPERDLAHLCQVAAAIAERPNPSSVLKMLLKAGNRNIRQRNWNRSVRVFLMNFCRPSTRCAVNQPRPSQHSARIIGKFGVTLLRRFLWKVASPELTSASDIKTSEISLPFKFLKFWNSLHRRDWEMPVQASDFTLDRMPCVGTSCQRETTRSAGSIT